MNQKIFFTFVIGLLVGNAFVSCTKSPNIMNNNSLGDTLPNLKNGTWSQVESIAEQRAYAVSFSINNMGYVGGGIDSLKMLNDFYQYNPSTGKWLSVAPFPGKARAQAVAFVVNGKAFVTTGADRYGYYYSDMYEYDPSANTWTEKASFPGAPRSGAVAFSIGNLGYVGFGTPQAGGEYLKDLYSYNPTTDTWSQDLGTSMDKRAGATAFVYNNEAYIIGGFNGISSLQSDFYKFNPTATISWTKLRPINFAVDSVYDMNYTDIERSSAVSFVIGDTAYLTTGNATLYANVATGSFPGESVGTTWAYNFKMDQWQKHPNFSQSVWGAASFIVNNTAYVGTGGGFNSSGSNFTGAFYQFNPTAVAQ